MIVGKMTTQLVLHSQLTTLFKVLYDDALPVLIFCLSNLRLVCQVIPQTPDYHANFEV